MRAYSKGNVRAARTNLSLEQLEDRQLLAANSLTRPLVRHPQPAPKPSTTPLVAVRTIDGTGNNLADPELGSANQQLLRVAPDDYGDDISTLAGADRPSARVISNTLAAQTDDTARNDRNMSALIYVFGQFLDHDIDLTNVGMTEVANIAVPTGDPQFDPNGTGTQVIPFTRSVYDPATGTSTSNPREQTTQITAWIDASDVYGSDQATADSLRTFVGGQLRTSAGNLLPLDADGNFMGGDVRTNENVELTSMVTLFVREHNRIATQLAHDNPTWTDEQIYQQARAMVGAEIQVITYKEFLPALLGPNALTSYTGYNPNVDPSISTEFSTAAFRLHSIINDDVEFFGNDGTPVRDEVPLADAFFNPALLQQTGIDSILKYAASTKSQEFDPQMVDSLRNLLFGSPGQGGLDLASLDIQRGRDHGLADYNTTRAAYGLPRVTSFAQITSDPQLQKQLQSLYGSVDNIDLWVGINAEDHIPGGSMGELGTKIVADQFERLRDGDRFWYERVFSGKTLAGLEQTTLADVIERNTTINNLQSNVFFMNAQVTGQVFADTNGNGRQDRNEAALAGVELQLLNDEGTVVATTTTGRDGHYQFTSFDETGDYQVRVVVPGRATAAVTTQDVLISRGDVTLGGVNFGLLVGQQTPRSPRTPSPPNKHWAAANDAVFSDTNFGFFPNSLNSTHPRHGGTRARALG
jgi:peroxidase